MTHAKGKLAGLVIAAAATIGVVGGLLGGSIDAPAADRIADDAIGGLLGGGRVALDDTFGTDGEGADADIGGLLGGGRAALDDTFGTDGEGADGDIGGLLGGG